MTKLINDGFKKSLRRKLRNAMTKSETVLWKYIKKNQLGCKFRRQVSIGNFLVDFYCPKLKLIVEVDGSTHNEESVLENDLKRDAFLKSHSFLIKRYNAMLVSKNLKEVLSDLYETCRNIQSKNDRNTPS